MLRRGYSKFKRIQRLELQVRDERSGVSLLQLCTTHFVGAWLNVDFCEWWKHIKNAQI